MFMKIPKGTCLVEYNFRPRAAKSRSPRRPTHQHTVTPQNRGRLYLSLCAP